ncbi:glutaredoxin 3 [Pseudocolwellia sp. AS88]|jgi:glutaredoxin 3|uniref:glutaredoxin 3 n=1 Tax=Pseudocolwellia TaxID=2848177 RepID=UPI0026EDF885|nr:glutaredoxin 3 [Pseudocolwellia sp. AS88]MDO7084093.1 glutaredoxin 3 [Pseudocolwellia sp. AS88]
MTAVDIYTKQTCPFCVRAKALLTEKNVAFNEIKIDGDNDLRTKMIERSKGAYTVPQIFFNENHIGGCDDLFALHTSGKLDELLK